MDIKELIALCKHTLHELASHKVAATLAAIFTAFLIFFVGVSLPQSYVSSALIEAERKSIIEPLLKGRAQVDISPVSVVLETLYSNKIMERSARELGLIDQNSTLEQIESARKLLSERLSHRVIDDKLLRLTFGSSSAEYSHQALSVLVDTFMMVATEEKVAESEEAYRFISEQVEKYKKQLAQAESRLSNYKIQNMDATERESFNRITELRTELEELELRIDEGQAKTRSLRTQIDKEGNLQQARSSLSQLLIKQRQAENTLQNLQLSFQEDYPDIVSTKSQIAQIQQEIAKLREQHPNLPSEVSQEETTLFDELRANLSAIELETESLVRRKQSLEKLLTKESQRADKAAIDQAMLSELTRDYDKTKQIYEEMLQRRENAKLSVAIDEQGQGMTFHIQERPLMPVSAQGPPQILFIAAAPFLAAMFPLGLCFVYVFLDPRIRYGMLSKSKLPDTIDIVVDIPAYSQEALNHNRAKTNWLLVSLVVVAAILYGYLASFWLFAE